MENRLIKIPTYKSGNFVFSLNYDKAKIREKLIAARSIYSSIRAIPILPQLLTQLEEELIKRSIFGTAAIEGNPLSEQEVGKVLDGEKTIKELSQPERQISNLRDAYNIIKAMSIDPNKRFVLNEETIKKIHSIITAEIKEANNNPGQYRNIEVKVGDVDHGGIYTPPKILDDIKPLMKEFVTWINSDDLLREDVTIRAALAHYYFALIHPFGNGNGRTARAIEALLLKDGRIKFFVCVMLSNYYYRNIDDYFKAFSLSERNSTYDITPFLEFFLNGLISSFKEVRSKIFAWIRLQTLRDYHRLLFNKKEISQRQYDLLTILIDTRESFELKELFNKEIFLVIYRDISERTARRDIEELAEKKLIELNKDEKYQLSESILNQFSE